MESERMDIAVIGAGLAGTLIAISLLQHLHPTPNITIYEARVPNAPELSSGVVLTPNGLSILSKLNIYDRIKDICWTNAYRTYKNDQDQTTRRVLVASEQLYGFQNHRLYRRVLLQTFKDVCGERGISIQYSARFDGITAEDSKGVTFNINGQTHRANLLIGADGIYSSVRKYLDANIAPEYTGTLGVLAHINWGAVDWPSPMFEHQCTIQGKPGALVMIPETRDGAEVMIAMQLKHADMSRQEWEALSRDKDAMAAFYRRGYEGWHRTGQKVIDAVCASPARETLYLWPFLRMPRLERWFSPGAKVVLVGDAAHAIPPSSGQGVNQALEDVWSLGLLLGQTRRPVGEALAFWQDLRQRRVDAVYDWAVNATGVARMPEEERRRLIAEGKVPDPDVQGSGGVEFFDDMAWLYRCESEREIQEWIDAET